MLNKVKQNPRAVPKVLKDKQELDNIAAHELNIRKPLNRHGVHDRTPGRKDCLHTRARTHAHTKRSKFAKDHLDTPLHYWKNVLWTDETKI